MSYIMMENFVSGQDGENVPWLSVSDIAPRGPSPGMLDITDLMGGGQAIGGVVGDGVSAGKLGLFIQRRFLCSNRKA